MAGVVPGGARLLAMVGPGLLAGLSDDDPAGVTTYSILGAKYGYELIWVLLLILLPFMRSLGRAMPRPHRPPTPRPRRDRRLRPRPRTPAIA